MINLHPELVPLLDLVLHQHCPVAAFQQDLLSVQLARLAFPLGENTELNT